MLDQDRPTLACFTGTFFDVVVSADLLPPGYEIAIRVKPGPVTVDLGLTGMHCPTRQQVRELIQLLRRAEDLAAFLDDGGRVENWHARREQHLSSSPHRN